ncbi:Na(+)/dicarboxylate symporter [uncultured Roseburia sp.]|uniref:Anion permease n=1 Tax=Brotonthovivens ammoniilytica TaxID=2981725 RepID=A0ABT2TEX0_9FIRM|nr:SLC13 family permease [Brotonthovivens ammoniilytica]MCU6760738.1 anion permease [Brotonthovivens ammoniilytica]SCI07665.1 Na(+)/dicarboxylate symporter [uncultured Roseburia sp.]
MASKKEYIHYLIALIIGIVIWFALPPTNGLTEIGVRVVAILIPVLYLWLTTNTHWTCFLALGLLVMTQAMTANEVWAGSMGHFVVITVIAYMVLNVCLKETGVINKIAIWFVTRKFVQGRPYAFMAMFFASNVIIGLFMDNLSLAVIYIGIAGALCEQIGVKKGDPFYTCIFTGVMWGNVILSIASPIAHALPNIIMGLAESQLGISISYGQWLAVGVPFAVLTYLAIMLVVLIWRPDTSAFKNFNVEEVRKNDPPLDARGKFAAFMFILVIIFVLAPSILKDVAPFFAYLNGIGVVIPALLAICVLAIVRMGGKPVLDVPGALRQVPLPAVIFAGTVSVFATPLSAENTGISVWLGNIFSFVEGMSPFAIVVILMIFAIIMTNFLSNTVTMVLFFNIGVVVLANGNTNMAVFTIIIALAASMASLTPSAAVPSPLFFGPGHVTMKNTLKWNLIWLPLTFVILVIFFPIFSRIMG